MSPFGIQSESYFEDIPSLLLQRLSFTTWALFYAISSLTCTKIAIGFHLFSSYAQSVGAHHFHTSAKLDRGIEDLFLDLTQRMMAKADERAKKESSASSPFGRKAGSIQVSEDSKKGGKSKTNCCGGGGSDSGTIVAGLPVDNNLAASCE